MKALKPLLPLVLLLLSIASHAQYETLSAIHIPAGATIIKTVKVKKCREVLPRGYVVKSEFSKTNGDTSYTVARWDTLRQNAAYLVEKVMKIEMTDMDGYANITPDEKDKSVLNVNYWLNPEITIKAKTAIKVINRERQCDTSYVETSSAMTLEKDAKYRFIVAHSNDVHQSWFRHSPKIIEVYKNDEKGGKQVIDYYLVDMEEKSATFSIKLENREFASYTKTSVEFGPIVIPLKYRFGYEKNKIKVNEEFASDFNVGIFVGGRTGKYRVRYEAPALKELSAIGFSYGGFLNLSSTTLDTSSTTAGNTPFKKDVKATIGILSPGIGGMLDVYNFKVGVFLGLDLGFGEYAKDWNFNNRPWLGIGLAYGITPGLWKK